MVAGDVLAEEVRGRRRRAVVLDDVELMRRGQCSAFAEADDFDLVGCASTAEALGWDERWHGVDVVVVDAYDPNQTFDRFVGVEVVARLRALDLAVQPRVFVVGLDAANPYLTLRLAEAGADHLYRRDEINSAPDLLAAVRRPTRASRLDPALARRELPAVSRPTRVNRLLQKLASEGLAAAFEPGVPQSASGFSRRQHINVRTMVHAEAGLGSAARHRTGGHQLRGVVPTWREVVDFVNRARGMELGAPLV